MFKIMFSRKKSLIKHNHDNDIIKKFKELIWEDSLLLRNEDSERF